MSAQEEALAAMRAQIAQSRRAHRREQTNEEQAPRQARRQLDEVTAIAADIALLRNQAHALLALADNLQTRLDAIRGSVSEEKLGE